MKTPFRLDKSNAILLGVCSGLAASTGLNATLLRIGLVVVTLLGAFPWTLILYGVAALVGQKRARSVSKRRGRFDDREHRLAEVDSHIARPNVALAREIESLR